MACCHIDVPVKVLAEITAIKKRKIAGGDNRELMEVKNSFTNETKIIENAILLKTSPYA
jgi:hypothetical protein